MDQEGDAHLFDQGWNALRDRHASVKVDSAARSGFL